MTTTDTMYRSRGIRPHHAGFGMWQPDIEPTEWYADIYDLMDGCEWIEEADFPAYGIVSPSGAIYNETGRVIAWKGDMMEGWAFAMIEESQP